MVARRSEQQEPPVEIKQFTAEEIDRGITNLRRRIQEVRDLNPRRVRHDDQTVRNAEMGISGAILEIFGPNSLEYRQRKHWQIFRDPGRVLDSEDEIQECFAEGIPQTVVMLEGLIARLEEKRAAWVCDDASRARAAFEGLDLHPRIAAVAVDLYRNCHYRNAVLDAYIALENLVKEKARRHDLEGTSLMRTVFSRNNPVLAFNKRSDRTEQDEQEGLMHLFEGAALALRNPRAHTLVSDTPEEGLEYIVFLSLLAKRVDSAQRTVIP